jgi:hypothetical protein
MGLWRWLFPTVEDRIAQAKQLVAAGAPADARATLDGLDTPEALAVLAEATRALARLNLQQAITWAEAGNDEGVLRHLELAEEFGAGVEAELRAARGRIRELREAHRAAAAAAKRAEPEVDALGLVGRAFARPLPEGLSGDAVEREARAALIVENYPEVLRIGLDRLGPKFLDALLTLHDGRPDLALQQLDRLPDHPLKHYETAMAAIALGDARRARDDLRRFADEVGHHPIGLQHTGVILAELEAAGGQPDVALRLLEQLRKADPRLGAPLYAKLLVDAGRDAAALPVLIGLVRSFPKHGAFALLLAEAQVRLGQRVPAMGTLEASLSACCATPGKCGDQPPDPEVKRRLATLYAEDGRDLPRAVELASEVGFPAYGSWEDAYLAALLFRRQAHPDAELVAAKLRAQTPASDPRRAQLSRYLPAA